MLKSLWLSLLLGVFPVFLYIPKAQSQTIVKQNNSPAVRELNPSWRSIVSHVEPLYATAGNPFDSNYLVNPGQGFDGVAAIRLITNNGVEDLCTGSLLLSGRHILTAAHCLTNTAGNIVVREIEVNFDLPSGRIGYDVPISNINLAPDWDGIVTNGNDLAILTLEESVPAQVDRYPIYRQSNEIDSIGVRVGYGRSGNGDQGDILPAGVKRFGLNRYDADGSLRNAFFGGATTGIIGYDFDNGLPDNDAFDFFFDIPNLGLGDDEVVGAPGDSGSPNFINGRIAGVTAFRETIFAIDDDDQIVTSDILPELNSSFGEFVYDSRVSVNADWIDSVAQVPESGTTGGSVIGMVFLSVWRFARNFRPKGLNRDD